MNKFSGGGVHAHKESAKNIKEKPPEDKGDVSLVSVHPYPSQANTSQISHKSRLNKPNQQLSKKKESPQNIGRFQLGDEVGRGAHGRVYRGIDLTSGQHVAIKMFAMGKFLKAEQRHQLTMEVDLLKKLDHPNIVKYVDTIQRGHQLCIVLEFVEGGSLAQLIKRYGPLTETLVVIYVKQVLVGLDYLHNQGITHRDIKGANILTTKDGIVKLADFGVATKLTDNERSNSHNSFAGTPYWMAPEVIQMSGNVTSACDIWSLGCTVYELLKGTPPFFDENQFTPFPAMIRIAKEQIPLPDDISEDLRDFFQKCFTKDPRQRPNARKLLDHPWLAKKVDQGKLSQIMSNNFPVTVTNTIRIHLGEKAGTLNHKHQALSSHKSEQGTRSMKNIEDSQQRKKLKPVSKQQQKQIQNQSGKIQQSQHFGPGQKIMQQTMEVQQEKSIEIQQPSLIKQQSGQLSATNSAQGKALLSQQPASKVQAKVTKVTLATRPHINVQIQQKVIESKKPVPTRAQLKVTKQPEDKRAQTPLEKGQTSPMQADPTKILATEENTTFDQQEPANGALFDLRHNQRPETAKVQSSISTAAKAKNEQQRAILANKILASKNGEKIMSIQQNAVGYKSRSRVGQMAGILQTSYSQNEKVQFMSRSSNDPRQYWQPQENAGALLGQDEHGRLQRTSTQQNPGNLKIKQKMDQVKLIDFTQINQQMRGKGTTDVSPDIVVNKPQNSPPQKRFGQQKVYFTTLEQPAQSEGKSFFPQHNRPVIASHLVSSVSASSGLHKVQQKNSNLGSMVRPASTQPVASPNHIVNVLTSTIASQPQQSSHNVSTSMMVVDKSSSLHSPQKSKLSQFSNRHTNLLLSKQPHQRLASAQQNQPKIVSTSLENLPDNKSSLAAYQNRQETLVSTKHVPHKSAIASNTAPPLQTTMQLKRSPTTSLIPAGQHIATHSDVSMLQRSEEADQSNLVSCNTRQTSMKRQNYMAGLSSGAASQSVRKNSAVSVGLGSNRSDTNLQRRQLHDQALRFATEIKSQVQLLDAVRDEQAERKLAALIATVTQLVKEYGVEQCNRQFQQSLLHELGLVSLIELLELQDRVSYPALQLINQVCEMNPELQKLMCLAGIVPHLKKFGQKDMPRELKVEVAYFIGKVYQCSREVLAMLVVAQALDIFVGFLELDFSDNKDLIMIAIDSFLVLFDSTHQPSQEEGMPLPLPESEVARILGKLGLFERLAETITRLIYQAEASTDLQEQNIVERYLERAFDVLYHSARIGPIEVKRQLCNNRFLGETLGQAVIQSFSEPTAITFQVTKWFTRVLQALMQTSQTFQWLGEQGIVKLLVEMLKFYMSIVDHIQLGSIYDALKLINSLIKMSTERSEQAVLQGGLLEPLRHLIAHIDTTSAQISRSKRVRLILSILNIFHELIISSTQIRQIMTTYKMHEVMLKILKINQSGPSSAPSGLTQGAGTREHEVNAKILDVFVLWLNQEQVEEGTFVPNNMPVQRFLAERKSLECIFGIFCLSKKSSYVMSYLLSSLNKICGSSSLICQSLISENVHLVVQLQQQMVILALSLVSEDQDGEVKHKPTKSSPSARNINSLLLKVVKAQQSEKEDQEHLGGHGSAQTQKRLSTFTGSQKTKSDASKLSDATVIQSLKDVMEILQGLVLTALRTADALHQQLQASADYDRDFFSSFVEQTGLIPAFKKIVKILNERNLVFLDSLGQNVLSLLFEGMQVSAANKATLAAQRCTENQRNRFKPQQKLIHGRYVQQTPDSSFEEHKSEGNDSSCYMPSDYDDEDFSHDDQPKSKSFSEEFYAGSANKPIPNRQPLDSSFQDDDDDDAYFDEMESESPLTFI